MYGGERLILRSVRSTASHLKRAAADVRERRRLGSIYSPDASNMDPHAHIQAAIDWLKRAQDTGSDRGVSYGAVFAQDFQESYPETTGYICRTFVDLWEVFRDPDMLDRAIQMGRWETDIQLATGAVMGGKFNRNPTPAVFNTGMVMLGWNALIRSVADEQFKDSTRRAADWLISVQEPDGHWIRGNSKFADPASTVYNVKAGWALCETGRLLGKQDYVEAGIRSAEYAVSRQHANGWFRECCLSDPEHPLLHTLAYTMHGLLEIGKLTGRVDFIEAARKTADAQIRIMTPDGFIPGRQDCEFGAYARWCCLTGSAQTSIIWSELFLITGEKKYREAVHRVNRYLLARHDIRNSDLRLRGGLPGAWPPWGDYGRFMILNWATKFLVDALLLELKISGSAD